MKEIWCDVVEETDLAQDREEWRAIFNIVMNFQGPKSDGKLLSTSTFAGF